MARIGKAFAEGHGDKMKGREDSPSVWPSMKTFSSRVHDRGFPFHCPPSAGGLVLSRHFGNHGYHGEGSVCLGRAEPNTFQSLPRLAGQSPGGGTWKGRLFLAVGLFRPRSSRRHGSSQVLQRRAKWVTLRATSRPTTSEERIRPSSVMLI